MYLKYPEDIEIPDNIIQQIQISHNFVESHIITEEKDWNSVSYYNSEKEIVIVLVLDKYDDGQDFVVVLEEFNNELKKNLKEEELMIQLKNMFKFSLSVFRTRDEVIAKLSNQVASLKMKEFDLEKRFEKTLKSEHLKVKSKLLFLLAVRDELNFKEIKKNVRTSNRWLEKVIEDLIKNKVILYNNENDTYFLNF